ncbi:MAG: hypothetical protein ACO4AM_05350 [Candidatus Nanopelagicaceae bacterium]
MDAPGWPLCDRPVPPASIEERADLLVDALLLEAMPLSPELLDAPLGFDASPVNLSLYMLRRLSSLDFSIAETIAMSSREVELTTDQA